MDDILKSNNQQLEKVNNSQLRANTGDSRELNNINRISDNTAVKNLFAGSKNEKIFRAIIENSSDITTVIDSSGAILFVSPSNERITGYKQSDLINKSVFTFIHPDDIDLIKNIYAKHINSPGRTEPFEFRYKIKSGSYIFLEAIANNLLHDPDLRFIVINSWNVTERKKRIEELTKLSSVVEQNPVSIIITDTNARIKYVNHKFTEQTGYTLQEVLDKNPGILRSEFTDPKIFPDMWKCILSGKSWSGQLCNRKKNGELYWEEISISPITDSKGRIIYFASAQEDITERKRIREELELRDNILGAASLAAHNLLRTPDFNKVMDSILGEIGKSCKADRAYIFQNQLNAAGDLVCSRKFEWTNEGIDPDYDNPDLQNFSYVNKGFEFLRKTLEANETFYGDIEKFPVSMNETFNKRQIKSILIQPIFVNEEFWGFIGLDSCISKREWSKSLRDSIIVVADTFGASLYRQKVEENLIIEKEKAEESNRLKTNFLANISHELRTPMVGIMGFTEMLAEEATDKSTKAMLDVIYNSSERLMETLDSILNISALESSRHELNIEKINLSDTLKSIYNDHKRIAERRGLELAIHLNDDKIFANVDVPIIRQVLSNLVKNAIKFTDKGFVSIRAEKLNHTVNTINIHITDTGIGIPDSYQKLIFEPFRQVSEGLDRKFEGVGLGLTLTKKYVELMGGKLSLVSEVGKGSTFTITLPLFKN